MLGKIIKNGYIKKDVNITIIESKYCIISEIFNEKDIKICDVLESQDFCKILNYSIDTSLIDKVKDLFFNNKIIKVIND